ncbi:hypothetical protein ACP70R_021846 [Stipagrostis hirtigluma subsp. patula]
MIYFDGRHSKTQIFQLEQEECITVGNDNLKTYISEFYKKLFGPREGNEFSLDEDLREDIPQVTNVENEFLTKPFTEREIKETVFQMEHNKTPV